MDKHPPAVAGWCLGWQSAGIFRPGRGRDVRRSVVDESDRHQEDAEHDDRIPHTV